METTTLLGDLRSLGLVALAMLFGAIIGIERERADRPAGLRTHMLVAGAAALFMSLADILVIRVSSETAETFVRTDPLRILEAVVAGISFLGAGTILRRHDSDTVEGLTTAASLLVTAAVGVCVALTHYRLAAGVTLFVVLTAYAGGFVKARLPGHSEKPSP